MSEFVALVNTTDPNVPTSSGQHVLMKDQTKIKRAIRRTTIVVNSRDRNLIQNFNSNQFRYTLRRPLTNIMSIELMNGCIPSYIYNVNTGWNTFDFQEGGLIVKITLRPGYYTESALLTELQTQLNAIPNKKNTYAVILNQNSKRVQITSSNTVPYRFLFYSLLLFSFFSFFVFSFFSSFLVFRSTSSQSLHAAYSTTKHKRNITFNICNDRSMGQKPHIYFCHRHLCCSCSTSDESFAVIDYNINDNYSIDRP